MLTLNLCSKYTGRGSVEGICVRPSRQSYPVELSFPLAKAAHFHQGDQGKHKYKFIWELTATCVSEEFLKVLCLQSNTVSPLGVLSFLPFSFYFLTFLVVCLKLYFFFLRFSRPPLSPLSAFPPFKINDLSHTLHFPQVIEHFLLLSLLSPFRSIPHTSLIQYPCYTYVLCLPSFFHLLHLISSLPLLYNSLLSLPRSFSPLTIPPFLFYPAQFLLPHFIPTHTASIVPFTSRPSFKPPHISFS